VTKRTRFDAALLGLEVALSMTTTYLLTILAGAATRSRAPRGAGCPPGGRTRFAILVPAHDEEVLLPALLRSVADLDYPRERREVVVVADNCSDRTAQIARAAGATVIERDDPARLGKGHALEWAFAQLSSRTDLDSIVVVDADCEVSANLLAAADQRLRAGARALQVDDVVSNVHESSSSALRFAAFALINSVRPLGKNALGFSCGLLGTGMVFSMELLHQHPWRASSMAEDAEYHLQLVSAGERVQFVPEARVSSSMPASLKAARDQNMRWEGGKWDLIRRWSPRLLMQAAIGRDTECAGAALDLLIPPQSLLFAANASVLAAAITRRAGLRLAMANLLGQAVYVLGGLLLVRAPVAAYRALLTAPTLALWKLGLYARLVARPGATGWIRTERSAAGTT
jgi:hypothetical protein